MCGISSESNSADHVLCIDAPMAFDKKPAIGLGSPDQKMGKTLGKAKKNKKNKKNEIFRKMIFVIFCLQVTDLKVFDLRFGFLMQNCIYITPRDLG